MQQESQASESREDKRKRSAILRNMQMLELIPAYPKSISVTKLHELLVEQGYQVSRRTIQRDLDSMSGWAEIDSQEGDNGNVWFRERKSDKQNVVSPIEAFMLLLHEDTGEQLIPEQFHGQHSERLALARALFSGKQELARWKTKISIVKGGFPVRKSTDGLSHRTRQTLYKGLLSEEKLNISYRAAGFAQPSTFIINPLALIVRDESHYLVATKNCSPEKPQLFLLHRIHSATRSYEAITQPESFKLADYLATNPSGWLLGDRFETVVLSVRNYALATLQQNHLGENQTLIQRCNIWHEARFELKLTYDLVAWILKFGADVKVESPQYLKEKVISILNKSINLYAE